MENKRRYKRVQSNYLLDVFDVKSKKILGQVLDITIEGFQLMSLEPIDQDSDFTVKMQMPEIISGHNFLKLLVKKIWTLEEMNIFYSGIHIKKISAYQTEVIRALIEKCKNS